MPRGHVHELEVVAVVLDLRAGDGGVAEVSEDPPQLARAAGHRVEVAAAQRRRRAGEVDRLGAHALRLGGALEHPLPLLERTLDAVLQRRHRLGDLLARRGVGDLPEAAEAAADQPVAAAEVPVLQLLEGVEIGGGGDLVEGARAQRVEILEVLAAGGGHRVLRRRRVGARAGASAPRATSTSWVEGRRVVHRDLGEHLAIDLDPGRLEPVHEGVVRDAVLPRRRVDARDPEPAHVALALLAIAVRVGERVHHRLVGGLEQPAVRPEKPSASSSTFL